MLIIYIFWAVIASILAVVFLAALRSSLAREKDNQERIQRLHENYWSLADEARGQLAAEKLNTEGYIEKYNDLKSRAYIRVASRFVKADTIEDDEVEVD